MSNQKTNKLIEVEVISADFKNLDPAKALTELGTAVESIVLKKYSQGYQLINVFPTTSPNHFWHAPANAGYGNSYTSGVVLIFEK